MGKIPGINHLEAVRALQKAGFRIVRQGKHIVMSDGSRILTLPRHNPVDVYAMGALFTTRASQSKSSRSCCEGEPLPIFRRSRRPKSRARLSWQLCHRVNSQPGRTTEGILCGTSQRTQGRISELRKDYVIISMGTNPEPDKMVLIFGAGRTPIIPYAN